MPEAREQVFLGERGLLVATLCFIVIAVLLPNTVLAWMRIHWAWFNLPMGWIERAQLPFNLIHGILFAGLGIAARLAFPKMRLWREAGWLLLFAATTELVQLWVPGRHARWSDFVVDLLAACFGMGLVLQLRRVFVRGTGSRSAAG